MHYRGGNKGLYVVARIYSCSCLTVLPGPDWVLLSKTYKPLFAPLYIKTVTISNVSPYPNVTVTKSDAVMKKVKHYHRALLRFQGGH